MYPKTLDALVHDVRYGIRLIRKAPGFSAVAIVLSPHFVVKRFAGDGHEAGS